MDTNHLVNIAPDERLDHLSSDGGVIRNADCLPHVVHERGEDDLVIGPGALRQRCRLQTVGELVSAEPVGDFGK